MQQKNFFKLLTANNLGAELWFLLNMIYEGQSKHTKYSFQ